MRQALHRLSRRQQLLFSLLGLIATSLVVVMAVVLPLHEWRENLRQEQAELQQELEQVQRLARELEQLRQTAPGQAQRGLSLSALVDQSLQGRAIQPSRIQLDESGQMQLRVNSAGFSEVVSWLAELESYPGVLASAVSIAREEDGRISLGLTLQQL